MFVIRKREVSKGYLLCMLKKRGISGAGVINTESKM
jgi:hypothetical protein